MLVSEQGATIQSEFVDYNQLFFTFGFYLDYDKMLLWIYSTIISLVFKTSLSKDTCFKDVFCIPDNYEKFTRPIEGTLDIDLEIDVIETQDINDIDFTAKLMLYFGAAWIEPRIISNSSKKYPIDLSYMDKFWVPDIYIYNMKNFKAERILTDLAGTYIALLNYYA